MCINKVSRVIFVVFLAFFPILFSWQDHLQLYMDINEAFVYLAKESLWQMILESQYTNSEQMPLNRLTVTTDTLQLTCSVFKDIKTTYEQTSKRLT